MIAHVAIPKSIWHPFSYRVPKEWESLVFPLQRVRIPFREKEKIGFVVGLEDGEGNDLKEIIEPIDFFPLIPESIGELIEWIRDNFLVPHGILLKYALSEFIKLEDHLVLDSYSHSELKGLSLKRAYKRFGRRKVLSLLHQGEIILRDVHGGEVFQGNPRQTSFSSVNRTVYLGSFEKRLDNYLRRIDETLEAGGSCLFFVPPYRLSGGKFFNILKERYGEKVIWYGKERGGKERVRTYLTVRGKSGFVVVSNILGLFLPVCCLGLILIERPEDENYVVDTNFSISIPECAIKRSEIENVPILIGTCSPSLSIFKRRNDFDWRDELDLKISAKIVKDTISGSKTRSLFHLVTYVKNSLVEKKRVAIFFPFGARSERIRCLSCNKIIFCEECGFPVKWVQENQSVFCERCKRVVSNKFECPSCKTTLLTIEPRLLDQFRTLIEQEGIKAITIGDLGSVWEKVISEAKDSAIILGHGLLSYAYGLKVDELILVGVERLKTFWSYRAYEKLHQLIMNLEDSLRPEIMVFYGSKLTLNEMDYLLNQKELYEEELKKRIDLELPPEKRLVLLRLERRRGMAKSKEQLYMHLKKQNLVNHIFGEKIQDLGDLQILKVLLRSIDPKDLYRLFPLFSISGLKVLVDPEVI